MSLKKNTIAVHSGLNIDKQYGCVVPPIYLSSTFNFYDFEKPRKHDYSRKFNPSRDIVQNTLSNLENGKGAIITNSGMSAIHLICTTFLKPNDLLIAPHDCYGGSYRLFNSQKENGTYHVKFINQHDIKQVSKILFKKPKIIFIESPSNPLLSVVDIRTICYEAQKFGTITVVDNTFMTPILQNPLKLGANLVLHSCTKYLNGHSDILSGAIISNNENMINQLSWWANNIGVTGSALDSYLLLRGLRTLVPRIKTAQNNAMKIVKFLKQHPLIKKVYYPALLENIGHKYALKQQNGFGAMLSFELLGNKKTVHNFINSLKLFTLAESLGGVESLISHPATMTHASMSKKNLKIAGISNTLLRISVGIEDKNDLIEDLEKALKNSNKR